MVRISQRAALGLDRPKRIDWKPFTASLMAKVRGVAKVMHTAPETDHFRRFYIGLGDRFDDDRRRVR